MTPYAPENILGEYSAERRQNRVGLTEGFYTDIAWNSGRWYWLSSQAAQEK